MGASCLWSPSFSKEEAVKRMPMFLPPEAFNRVLKDANVRRGVDGRQIINGRTTNIYIYCAAARPLPFIILFAYVISQ